MAGKADFTPDEWTALKKSPLMASLVVVAASPSGPLGVMKEMFAVGKLVAETKAKGGSNGLIDGIVGAPGDPRRNGHLRNGHDRSSLEAP